MLTIFYPKFKFVTFISINTLSEKSDACFQFRKATLGSLRTSIEIYQEFTKKMHGNKAYYFGNSLEICFPPLLVLYMMYCFSALSMSVLTIPECVNRQ